MSVLGVLLKVKDSPGIVVQYIALLREERVDSDDFLPFPRKGDSGLEAHSPPPSVHTP